MNDPAANILALETSSSVLSVAVKRGNSPAVEKSLKGFLQHAESLLPLIDELLTGEGITLRDVGVLLTGRGPGSFTGLRIGFATIKGILAAHKKDCFGALSLDAAAANADPRLYQKACAAMDARRDMVYARFYTARGGKWEADGEAQVLKTEEFAAKINGGCAALGDAFLKYGEILRAAGKKIQLLPEDLWFPKASSLINWYTEFLKTGRLPPELRPLSEPGDFIPLYLRLSEAEERKK